MQFSVLGPLEVMDDRGSLPLGGPRQRSVLALLLLGSDRVVGADRIVTEIWGDRPPDGARDSLYTYVSNLRGVLGRDRIVRTDGGYRLEPLDGDTFDADDVAERLTEAHGLAGTDPATAVAVIDRSLSAWRGRPYEGLEDLPSVAPEAARLAELRLRALEDRIEAELGLGGTPEVGAVERLTADHPYRERLWELLARVLYRAGRQTDALRALARLRRMLADDLGLEPSPGIVRLEERILLQDPALDTDAAPPTNLPAPVSSFIGRIDELGEVGALLGQQRLVTITGPGGAGKTRLAIEVADRVAGGFPDGVWFVDLAPIDEPDGAVQAIASLVVPTAAPTADLVDTIVTRLRPQTTLIVLDNCERVADAVGDVATRLLAGAPRLRILATSRRSLDVAGEALSPLVGLGTSTGDTVGDAERLFETRAGAVQPGFSVNDTNRTDISEICRHLDGLPLALELAAARVDTLSPGEIARHLDDRFRLLSGSYADRSAHRSLLGSLDWSLELLDADDRWAFDQLGVFDGPFTAGGAAAVFGAVPEIEAIQILRRLLAASLIHIIPGPASHYRMLETTRLYARTHLDEADGWQVAVERHDDHYRTRCRDLRIAIFGSGRPEACRMIEAEIVDFEVALDRLLDDDPGPALEMGWALGHVWLFSGRLNSGIGRLENLVEATVGARSGARADALTAGSFLLMYLTRYGEAIAWSDEAIDLYRSLGDERGLAYALARRGHLAFSVGDVPTALALLQESLETCERIGYDEGTAWPLTLLGQARLWGGDESDEVRRMLEAGRQRFIAVGDTYGQVHANMFIPNVGDQGNDVQLRYAEESLELAGRPSADPLVRPVALHNLAFSVWNAGERERAVGQNRLSARAAIETGATVSSGMAFLQAGLFAGLTGDAERAATLYGAGDRYFVMTQAPFYERQLQPGIDAAIAALGEERYCRLFEDGSAMTVEGATEYLIKGS